MRANKSQKLLLSVGLILPFVALAVSWPQSTGSTAGRRPLKSGGSVEIDNVAEPMILKLTNNAGELEAMVQQNVSEWTDLHGRKYRATVTVRKFRPK